MTLQPNRFGLPEALLGFACSFVLADLGVEVFGALTHHLDHPGTFGADLTSLVVLWSCWIAAALYASAVARRRGLAGPLGLPEPGPPEPGPPGSGLPVGRGAAGPELPGPGLRVGRGAAGPAAALRDARLELRDPVPPAGRGERPIRRWVGIALRRLRDDYGLEIRPWPDVPLGIAIGLGSQYLLVPLFEAPLLPFVPHLYSRLGGPAHELAGGASGAASLAVLGIFVCVGSPVVEELFFRGLLLRAVAGRLGALGRPWCAVVSVAVVALVFGVAHFEALQLIGLVGFGAVLGALAWTTGRVGPGIVAHAAFNAATIVALALAR